MSTSPLSPRSQVCAQLQGVSPCEVTFSTQNLRFTTSVDNNIAEIKDAFDTAMRYFAENLNRHFSVQIQASNSSGQQYRHIFDPKPIVNIPIVESDGSDNEK